jgi:amino acid transporter
MAYVVFALYFIYTLGQVLNVKWTPIDPTLFGGFSLVIVATWQADSSHIANFLNACLVFSLLFSSTTCLYIASRTLYGLANDVPNNSAIGRILHKLASGVRRTGAPVSAVLLSFLMFVCILYIQLSPESGEQDVSRLQGLIVD